MSYVLPHIAEEKCDFFSCFFLIFSESFGARNCFSGRNHESAKWSLQWSTGVCVRGLQQQPIREKIWVDSSVLILNTCCNIYYYKKCFYYCHRSQQEKRRLVVC